MILLVSDTFFLSVLAFTPISRSTTNSIKWQGKLQIYIMFRYMHSTDITLWFGIILIMP